MTVISPFRYRPISPIFTKSRHEFAPNLHFWWSIEGCPFSMGHILPCPIDKPNVLSCLHTFLQTFDQCNAFQLVGQPLKTAHSQREIWTPSNMSFLGPTQPTTQRASPLVHPFVQGSVTVMFNRQTNQHINNATRPERVIVSRLLSLANVTVWPNNRCKILHQIWSYECIPPPLLITDFAQFHSLAFSTNKNYSKIWIQHCLPMACLTVNHVPGVT